MRGLCLAVLLALAAQPAAAGIGDSPLPVFPDGSASVVVYRVAGVVKRTRAQTDFLCTSLDSRPVHVGVEIFGPDGARLNDVHAGIGVAANVAPGQTVTIGTSATAALLETVTIPLTNVSQGSARVVASSDMVRCNAVILDDAVSPPVSVASLSQGTQPQQTALGQTPLPLFADGKPSTHSLVIPGIAKRTRVQTDFFCTSLAAAPIDVGVELFAPDGALENQIQEGNGAVLNVAPGATVTIGTTGTASLLESTVITARGVAQGFARVVSTSGDVLCSALILDSGAIPPVSMTGLVGADTATAGDVNRDGVVNAADAPALVRQLFR